MPNLTIIQGDNLPAMADMIRAGLRFDLIELDGPYGADLEEWDELNADQYLRHYSARLPLVRELLHIWGAVFVFGYPEGCAEIKAWCHTGRTLYCRRWLTWYKQRTAHMGRKCETILFMLRDHPNGERLAEFGAFLRQERRKRNWTLRTVGMLAGRPWWHRGGNLYYETGSGSAPSAGDLQILARIFDFDPAEWRGVIQGSYPGLTDRDLITSSYEEPTKELNGIGLRSKPISLYSDLFAPLAAGAGATRRALILYGGSGNAAIAAGLAGYDVTVCERDPARCEIIRRRFDFYVNRHAVDLPGSELGPLFNTLPAPGDNTTAAATQEILL